MINTASYKLTDELKKEYYSSFNSENDSKKFKFLRKLLCFVENDSSSYNALILFENPLKNKENKNFINELNNKCREFLDLKKNSENKHIRGSAFCYIGVGYEYGLFEYFLDYESAFNNYLISSRISHDLGTYKLAQCYEQGKGTEQDPDKALYFYRCAAKLGLVDALHVYGTILVKGNLGNGEDQKTGLHYVSLAAVKASKLYPFPLYDIARWYETKQTNLDLPVDEKYSFEVYMKGAMLDDPNSSYRIAKCYENGELGKPKCINTAIEWYKKAAENGQADAQMILFGFYSSGVSNCLKRDMLKSYYWAICSSARGNARAAFFLGEYSRSGIKSEPDILLSLWWYTISSTLGSYEATIKMRETRAEIEKRDIGPEIPYMCCGIIIFKYYDD